jgi:lipopolysaccharide transport system ATP-binding protein
MSSVIKVENLSKQYRLGEIGTGSISHDINRWWHTVRGKEDPYLKIGETNDRSKKVESKIIVTKKFDFSEIAGKLSWNGDALEEQKNKS